MLDCSLVQDKARIVGYCVNLLTSFPEGFFCKQSGFNVHLYTYSIKEVLIIHYYSRKVLRWCVRCAVDYWTTKLVSNFSNLLPFQKLVRGLEVLKSILSISVRFEIKN
jgi:hypothetical protein